MKPLDNPSEIDKIRSHLTGARYQRVITIVDRLVAQGGAFRFQALLLKMDAFFEQMHYGRIHEMFKVVDEDFLNSPTIEQIRYLIFQAKVYHQECRYLTALDKLANAESLLAGITNKYERKLLHARVFTKRGVVLQERKNVIDDKKALVFFNKAIEILVSLPNTRLYQEELAHTYGEMGRLYADHRCFAYSLTKAVEYFEKDLRISIRFKDKRGIGIMRNQLALCYNRMGEPKKALKLLSRNLRDPAVSLKSRIYGTIESARSYRVMNQTERVTKLLDDSIILLGSAFQRDSSFYFSIAELYAWLGIVDKALKYGKLCIKIIERARTQIGTPANRRAYMQSQQECFLLLEDICRNSGRIRDAVAFHQMAGARTSNDMIFMRDEISTSLLKKTESFTHYNEAMASFRSGATFRKNELLQAAKTLYDEIECIQADGKKTVRLTVDDLLKDIRIYFNQYPSAALLIPTLKNHCAVIYLLTRKNATFFTVSPFSIESVSKLSSQALDSLGEKIMKPVLQLCEGIDKLTIITDLSWQDVHFQASMVNGKPAGCLLPISYRFSLHALAMTIKNQKKKLPYDFYFFSQTDRDDGTRFISEMEAISKIVDGKKSTVNKRLIKEELISSLKKDSIVHIAAHNKFFKYDFFTSLLECDDNNYITPADILINGECNARLIVLGACESSVSGGQHPREPSGHVYTLLSMGVGCVIALSRKILGNDSIRFFKEFYENLLKTSNILKSYHLTVINLYKSGWQPRQFAPFFLYL